jgi:hypothetical protein
MFIQREESFMFLENTRMKIAVAKKVVLGGHTFRADEKLMAQATDSGLITWHVGYKPGNSVCIVNKAELEKHRTANAIDFDWPARRRDSIFASRGAGHPR